MNREELEKMFNEKYKELGIQSDLHQRGVLRDFVIDTIIPEVLKSVIIKEYNELDNQDYIEGYNDCISDIEDKLKELYNIKL